VTVMVRISAGEFIVEISSDREPYADLMDEMCTRAVQLFARVQAGLSDDADDPSGGGDDDGA
jgi:methyl coenzyme M reductase subunit D